jgi:FKBP-type peptidyl-prolyl cis-trans isomerase FklB
MWKIMTTLLPAVDLDSDEQKASYGFGLQFGDQLRRNSFDGLDLDAVLAGIRHWYEHQQAALTDEDINDSYKIIQARREAQEAAVASKREELADIFLQANAAREGVSVTDSGLQYEVLESGGGSSPGPQSTVVTHYHGTLVDGTVFDSSVDRGEPAEFGVHEVIPAWTEALQMMSVGDKWRIACPPRLAYGEQGAGGAIAPNSALVFEIHLISIKD